MKLIEQEISSSIGFETWILPIVPVGIDGSRFLLQVSDNVCKEILEKRHLTLIRSALKNVTGINYAKSSSDRRGKNSRSYHSRNEKGRKRRCGAESESQVCIQLFRGGQQQPYGSRGIPCRCRISGKSLQPFIFVRKLRAGQNPPDAFHCPLYIG